MQPTPFENMHPAVAPGNAITGGTMVIFGNGQLATAYDGFFSGRTGWKVVRLPRDFADVRDAAAVDAAVGHYRPDVILNCAAKTDIDWCEKGENRLEAVAVNTNGAGNIALAAAKHGAFLVHISSGCIQESLDEHDMKREEDPANPLCYYSWTKVWAEQLVLDAVARRGLKALILRPRQLLAAHASRRNALVKMLTYRELINTANSCTVVEDLLVVTDELLHLGATGVFNVVNPGLTSPYRIAQVLKEVIKPDMEFQPIAKAALNGKTFATRIDAVLSGKKLSALGITLAPIESRLREIVADLKRNLETPEGSEVYRQVVEDTRQKLAPRTEAITA